MWVIVRACHPCCQPGAVPATVPEPPRCWSEANRRKARTDEMHPSPRLRRENSRTAKLDIRLTPAEKQALAQRAKHAGAPVCELVRSAVENLLGTRVDYRSAELLRIMGEIVQQNLLL